MHDQPPLGVFAFRLLDEEEEDGDTHSLLRVMVSGVGEAVSPPVRGVAELPGRATLCVRLKKKAGTVSSLPR
ncbi:hypothetical protein MTO96_025038 [Rhipicephalus appendiculatus]